MITERDPTDAEKRKKRGQLRAFGVLWIGLGIAELAIAVVRPHTALDIAHIVLGVFWLALGVTYLVQQRRPA